MFDSVKYVIIVALVFIIVLFVAFMPHQKVKDLKEIIQALASIL